MEGGMAHLGQRHVCGSCTARFYDLNKTPVICPKCQEEVSAIDTVFVTEQYASNDDLDLFLEEEILEGYDSDFEEDDDFVIQPISAAFEEDVPENKTEQSPRA
jgi:hypothetical protein